MPEGLLRLGLWGRPLLGRYGRMRAVLRGVEADERRDDPAIAPRARHPLVIVELRRACQQPINEDVRSAITRHDVGVAIAYRGVVGLLLDGLGIARTRIADPHVVEVVLELDDDLGTYAGPDGEQLALL